MKKVILKIKNNKVLTKKINDIFFGDNEGEKINHFIEHAKRYIKACEEERLICVINSVSSSGMSRNLNFFEHKFDKKLKRGFILQFHSLFKALGYTERNNGFTVSGCGMDMIFATNYNNISDLCNIGLLNKDKADILKQKMISTL